MFLENTKFMMRGLATTVVNKYLLTSQSKNKHLREDQQDDSFVAEGIKIHSYP